MKKEMEKYNSISNQEFLNIVEDLINNKTVQEMKKYRQHYETTCFDHCYMVSYYCYLICKKYHLDYISATRAAMLHDLFLYDWRVRQPGRKGLHAFTHGKTACENASKLFDLSQKEKDMILTHMWPITMQFPTSVEGFILTFVDKYCALAESFSHYREVLMQKDLPRLANTFAIFLSAFLLI